MQNLEPGAELDKFVAEKVMGWTSEAVNGFQFVGNPNFTERDWLTMPKEYCPYPRYSTDISAAWEVVEKLKDAGLMVDIQVDKRFSQVQIESLIGTKWDIIVESTEGKTAAHAICLAALKVKEE